MYATVLLLASILHSMYIILSCVATYTVSASSLCSRGEAQENEIDVKSLNKTLLYTAGKFH